MHRTKDGHEVTIGLWVTDGEEVDEVLEITDQQITLKEVIFINDGGDYRLGAYRFLSSNEIKDFLADF